MPQKNPGPISSLAHLEVHSAFVVLSNELERDWLMQQYRFATVPLLRHLQWRSKRYCGKWSLKLRAAPEPCDILWAHYLDSRWYGRVSVAYQLLLRSLTLVMLGVMLCSGIAISWMIWWQTLEVHANLAMKCSIWSVVGEVKEGTCQCFCVCPLVDPTCETWKAPLGVFTNWLLAEVLQVCCNWFVLWHTKWWRSTCRSWQENERMILLAVTQSASALCPVLGLWLLKLTWSYGILEAPVDGENAWQCDLAFYLYGLPVIELWCLGRWLTAVIFRRCTTTSRTSQRFILWRQYASLASQRQKICISLIWFRFVNQFVWWFLPSNSWAPKLKLKSHESSHCKLVVTHTYYIYICFCGWFTSISPTSFLNLKVSVLGITLIFQPMAPILTPLTALGLLCRYWSEKLMMVNGAMTVPGAQIRTVESPSVFLWYLW